MVGLFSAVVGAWLAGSLLCFVWGFMLWNFPVTDGDKRLGSRMFLVTPVWPVAFLVWLVMNFRRLLADAGWGQR